jgi:hypothetical protein
VRRRPAKRIREAAGVVSCAPMSETQKRARHNEHTRSSRLRIDQGLGKLKRTLKRVRPTLKLTKKADIVDEAVKLICEANAIAVEDVGGDDDPDTSADVDVAPVLQLATSRGGNEDNHHMRLHPHAQHHDHQHHQHQLQHHQHQLQHHQHPQQLQLQHHLPVGHTSSDPVGASSMSM